MIHTKKFTTVSVKRKTLMTKNERVKFHKTIKMYRDVHTKHFHNIKWLRHTLGAFLPKHVVEKVVWDNKF